MRPHAARADHIDRAIRQAATSKALLRTARVVTTAAIGRKPANLGDLWHILAVIDSAHAATASSLDNLWEAASDAAERREGKAT